MCVPVAVVVHPALATATYVIGALPSTMPVTPSPTAIASVGVGVAVVVPVVPIPAARATITVVPLARLITPARSGARTSSTVAGLSSRPAPALLSHRPPGLGLSKTMPWKMLLSWREHSWWEFGSISSHRNMGIVATRSLATALVLLAVCLGVAPISRVCARVTTSSRSACCACTSLHLHSQAALIQ